MSDLFIGLMSGTSLDGVDGVLADFSGGAPRVLASAGTGFTDELRAELLALNQPGRDELHRAWLAGNGLMRSYAEVVRQLLAAGGVAADDVAAIGAHGQTVRHRPRQFDGTGYTIQLAQPALLAELTGIDVVADFRSRDVAAGGQGAPLAPFFHRAAFAQPGMTVGVLNLGGMSNLTVLHEDGNLVGFDCGPGNVLMDEWCAQHLGQPFDRDGAWAAQGVVLDPLLKAMLSEPFFGQAPPKSTGRDTFSRDWLDRHLPPFASAAPVHVQATLAELTATTCAADAARFLPELRVLIVCGGGALNLHLVARLRRLLPTVRVAASDEFGVPPTQVEALAFAWLARKAVRRDKLELTSTTGARGARVLGAVYPR